MGKSIREALREAASFLQQRGIDGARVDAELLLAFLLGVERPHLYAHDEAELSPVSLNSFEELIRRRGNGEPMAYIRGEKEFMGLSFYVEPGVFIPRPETEHLVEAVLQWTHSSNSGLEGEDLNFLQLGTGSGIIPVSLAVYLPQAHFVAVDTDEKALKTAAYNSRRHMVETRIVFRKGHFYEAVTTMEDNKKRFNVIVSNPPYIEEGMLSQLSPEVQQEPRQALNGGVDGLDAYREILAGASDYLLSPGLLALELGAGQATNVIEIATRNGFSAPQVHHDYAGIERVLLLKKVGKQVGQLDS